MGNPAKPPSPPSIVVPAPAALPSPEPGSVLRPGGPLLPLERITSIAPTLDGHTGINRDPSFCLISAQNDLQAVHAYLYRFRHHEKTWRSYRKEIERFLLWCVQGAGLPMSAVLLGECERYKAHLARVPAAWQGPRAPRTSERWRPFAGPLSMPSQRYAIQVLRGFFGWLVKVRYLSGNPWVTVADPFEPGGEDEALGEGRALPETLWQALCGPGGILARATALAAPSAQAQLRLARAAIELIGETGIRREEAAMASRAQLKPVEGRGQATGNTGATCWELSVLGKRGKWRSVFLREATARLLREHWRDRGHDFDDPRLSEMALLSPVVVPGTPSARAKHLRGGALSGAGFSPDGLYRLVKALLIRLAEDQALALSESERQILRASAPHALRHTFATRAVAGDLPLDVLQRLMGHASIQTTGLYVHAERARSLDQLDAFFKQQAQGK